MMKFAGVAFQVRLDLAQAPRTGKLCMQHRNQMSPGLDAAIISVSAGFIHKTINDRPRNLLQDIMKNDSLVPHGFGPFSVQMIRNQLISSRINAVRFFKHRTCRTLVRQARA